MCSCRTSESILGFSRSCYRTGRNEVRDALIWCIREPRDKQVCLGNLHMPSPVFRRQEETGNRVFLCRYLSRGLDTWVPLQILMVFRISIHGVVFQDMPRDGASEVYASRRWF